MTTTPAKRHFERGYQRTHSRRRAALAAVAGLAVLLFSGAAAAAEQVQAPAAVGSTVCATFRVRPQDQVWLVSTRHLGCYGGAGDPGLLVWRYQDGLWQPASRAEFYAADSPDVITPIWIHGNQIDFNESAGYGLSVYFQMVGKLDGEPPARFVIWSWPSDKIRGVLRDVRAKAARSDIDAQYLGSFLAGMRPDVRVGVIGYSYGARIVSGAMHLLGGGELLGQVLPPTPRPQVRLALWAAAEHDYWYLPGQFHDRALSAADAWFITLNYCDPVLSRYRFLDPCAGAQAVGHSGISGRQLLPPDVNARLEEVNVTNLIGKQHNWRPYLYSLYIQDRTRDYVMWHDL